MLYPATVPFQFSILSEQITPLNGMTMKIDQAWDSSMGQGRKTDYTDGNARGTVTHRLWFLLKHFWRGNRKPGEEFWYVIY